MKKLTTKKKVKRPYVMMSKVILVHKSPEVKKLEANQAKRNRHRYETDEHGWRCCKKCWKVIGHPDFEMFEAIGRAYDA